MKSECPHIRQFLSEYIDGALDASEMNAVREHLEACKGCRHEHETLQTVISALGNISSVKAPDDFVKKLHERIRHDSFFDRIRELFSFTRIRIPIEVAAFATTAVLILLVFTFFPAEEKGIIKNLENHNSESTIVQKTLPTQTVENQTKAVQSTGSPIVSKQAKVQPFQVKLALSLTAKQDITPIPSQSVSFGDSGTEYNPDDQAIWPSQNKIADDMIQPDEVNTRIDEIIKSVEGKTISRDNNINTGYPTHLTLEIPATNYRRFLSKIETLGAIEKSSPDLPEASKDARVLIKMEVKTPE